VEHPKKREVFAAQFADRIVHHLYYNYTHELFERTFIQDCYSCIKGRGTHYGIERLERHIRSESKNYKDDCFVLKLDIRGYFMHINREVLCNIASETISKMSCHKIGKGEKKTWADVIDIDFILWLTREITLLDPKKDCRILGSPRNWEGMDRNKTLLYTEDGCGLPIGNLTSQLFSNVYMNVFDQWMKRTMKCRHYGRYVDDCYVVSRDREWLLSFVPRVSTFIAEKLGLELHMGKLSIVKVQHGVTFLGAFIKPYRRYISHDSLSRIVEQMRHLDYGNKKAVWRSVNSFLGILAHYASFNIRCGLFLTPELLSVASYDKNITKMNKPYIIKKNYE
jgi:hypothetical protein